MEFRNLGASGLRVSAISYGNWLTHGSQVEEDAALACVRQALDEGITTFDTADVYANTAAETVLGKALAGERRAGLEIFTKVFFPTGPGGHNDHGLSRKHILESIDGSLRRLQHRLRRPLPGPPLRPRDPARGDDAGLRRRRARGQGALHRRLGVAGRGDPRRGRAGRASCTCRWSPTSRSTTCSGASSSPRSSRPARSSALGQVVWSPIAQGVLTGKYHPGAELPAGSRATDEKGGADMIARWLKDDVLERVQRLQPVADEAGLSMAQLAVAWTLQNPNVSSAIIGASRPEQVTDNVKAAGVTLDADVLTRDRRGRRRRRRARRRQDPVAAASEIFG